MVIRVFLIILLEKCREFDIPSGVRTLPAKAVSVVFLGTSIFRAF